MPQIVYKTLNKQVMDMIRRYSYKPSADTNLSQYFAGGTLGMGSSVDTKELISSLGGLLDDMKSMIKPWIKTGLDITASSPWNDQVSITSGVGFAGGRKQVLNQNATLQVPLDGETSIFYLNVWEGQITLETYTADHKLNIGTVVIPQPGTTTKIRDDKPTTGYDGYVISGKDIFYNESDQFDDVSKQILKDNIGAIMAETIIGTMTIGESLKVTNTQGTMEITSKDIKIFYDEDNVAAKFDKTGTYYYDESGLEYARFSSQQARVGNIVIEPNLIRSDNFVEGPTFGKGFAIQDNGFAEFENVTIRGALRSSVFEYDTVSVVGGQLLVSPASVLDADMTALDNSTLIAKDNSFSVNEVVRIKEGNNNEYLLITDISSAPTYCVTRDLAGTYGADTNPAWTTGVAVGSMGIGTGAGTAVNTGFINMDTVSGNSPYIDILKRNSTYYSDYSIKSRLGNLDGIFDPLFPDIGGFGLYADNVFLKGCLYIAGSNWSHENDGTKIDGGEIYTNTITATQISVANLSAICADLGEVTAGIITGLCIRTAVSGERIEMNSTGFRAYDSTGDCYSYLTSGALRFHTCYDDIPYAKRISSGTATTGSTVVLCRWATSPEIIVGVKELRSYDSSCTTGCQSWCVYYDALSSYDNGGSDFGYCFDVHAQLELSAGVAAESVVNLAFGVCQTTHDNTTCSLVKFCFTAWCNPEGFCCYYYGCLCYEVCYKVTGAGSWEGSCNYIYTQPSGSEEQLKGFCCQVQTVTFPCAECWVIMACCTGISWTITNIETGACVTCTYCCCRAYTGGLAVGCAYENQVGSNPQNSGSCHCCVDVSLAGSDPAAGFTIYCTYACFCWCSLATHHLYGESNATCHPGAGASANAIAYVELIGPSNKRISVCSVGTSAPPSQACTFCYCEFDTKVVTNGCYCCVRLHAYGNASASSGGCIGSSASAIAYACICLYGGYLIQCNCCIDETGAAACCIWHCLHSTTDTTTSSVILDPSGCLSWLAIAYS